MDYRSTLNLPMTDFPMRANLAQQETRWLQRWEEMDLYGCIRQRHAGDPKYILHDGPPYANGHIHMGTALNKVLKDLVVKVKAMEGYDAVYVPGWDCHGLPIEHQVGLELGESRWGMGKGEIRRRCREFASRFLQIQREEFKRLGVLADWAHPYLTMDYHYEATIIRELGKFFARGGVYRGRKPIHWCPTCETALAEAEIDYLDRQSPSIYVRFPLHPDAPAAGQLAVSLPRQEVSVVIWTTTPWTLPANLAICLHPTASYVLVETPVGVLLMAQALLQQVMAEVGIQAYKVLQTMPGERLAGMRCRHPLVDRLSPLLMGGHVTLDQGTGCVHTAPGHGVEDYEIGVRHGLEIYNPVDGQGRFLPDSGPFAGLEVFAANGPIIEALRHQGHLLAEGVITHSYPHCWRCKHPLILRATPQWFISLEANGLRQQALAAIREVEWIPAWGRERIYQMVERRSDWCISRQRAWGVPIPVFYCGHCQEVLASEAICQHVANLVEADGADVWFERSSEELLPDGTPCPRCGGGEFRKEEDILDVWFDSGVSHAAVLKQWPELTWPADLYLEGSDQHRGWFHSSLLASVGTTDRPPYRAVLTHGYVVDGGGKKMSKSAGNVIAPQEVIDRYGAEILRLWVASENYREDIRISEPILRHLTEIYRRIRNTCRFMLGNLYDFDPGRHLVAPAQRQEIDRLMLHRLQQLIGDIRRVYADHAYHLFFHLFHNFCAVDLSAFYLDILKDRLYTSCRHAPERRAAQSTLYELLLAMVRLMAPVLSFTAEEVWHHLPPGAVAEASVHLARFPAQDDQLIDPELEGRWARLLEVRREVLRVLEQARVEKLLGGSLEAQVDLFVPPELLPLLQAYEEELPYLFIVSATHLVPASEAPDGAIADQGVKGLFVQVRRAAGQKCARCWLYSESVGGTPAHPTLCGRCVERLAAGQGG